MVSQLTSNKSSMEKPRFTHAEKGKSIDSTAAQGHRSTPRRFTVPQAGRRSELLQGETSGSKVDGHIHSYTTKQCSEQKREK
jgi:hypothetical protein